MRVDIQPQFKKIADWYWEKFDQPGDKHLSIWDVLERDYGARKVRVGYGTQKEMIVEFPNKASYTMFVLRWV